MNAIGTLRTVGAVLFSALFAALQGSNALAQNAGNGGAQSPPIVQLNVTSADRAEARSAVEQHLHMLPSRTEAARDVPLNWAMQQGNLAPVTISAPTANLQSGESGLTIGMTLPSVPAPGFYPADLSKLTPTGKVVAFAQSINVYVNCNNDTCWGDPVGFLNDLAVSKFAHVADQYVGKTWGPRYTLGPQFKIVPDTATFFSVSDILAIVHAAAVAPGSGNGYHHIIHVFLTSGVDTCADNGNTQCYSPDHIFNFSFCAYHSSVVFNDIGETLFSVEPFQDVAGCAVAPPSPHSQEIDSTNSTLSHELFETITDPDPPSSWIALSSLDELGREIGDECQGPPNGSFEAIVPQSIINLKIYQVQLEYSNTYHACASRP